MLAENVLWHLNPRSRRPDNNLVARVLIVQGPARSRADTAPPDELDVDVDLAAVHPHPSSPPLLENWETNEPFGTSR